MLSWKTLAREVLPVGRMARAGFDAALADRMLTRLGSGRLASAGRVATTLSEGESLPYEQLVQDERAFAVARKLARATASRVLGLREFLELDRRG